MADGKLPFVPSKYKMRVTDKVTDRRLKRLVRKAKEIVFASPEGAGATGTVLQPMPPLPSRAAYKPNVAYPT